MESQAAATEQIARGLEATLRKVRGLARGLVKVDLDKAGLHDALRRLGQDTQRQYEVVCHVSVSGKGPAPEPPAVSQLYRIVQEAVANAVHHGQPATVRIELTNAPECSTLTVRDDGRGFDPNQPANEGLGLRIMRHRAELIGADFAIDSKVGAGTKVTCRLNRNS